MSKIDFKKKYKDLYKPSKKEFSIVDVPPMNFLMIDGHGDPNNNPEFQQVMNTLYSVAYTIKFKLKTQGRDYVVPPLEGLWWTDPIEEFSVNAKDKWDWTVMVMQPDWVSAEIVEQSSREVAQKKELPMLSKMRYEVYHEGLSVQILYIGAYSDEGPTISRMHKFISQEDYVTDGKHHEIYLSDPRRTAPDRLKTVIRQPISKL